MAQGWSPYSDGTPSAIFTYDQGTYGNGRLSTVTNPIAESGFIYDKMGGMLRETKTIGGLSFSHSLTYNLAGMPVSETLPNGKTISRDYDRLGRLTAVNSDWADAEHPGLLASDFVYAPGGAPTSVSYGNGTTSTRSYTGGGLLKTLRHGSAADPGSLADFEYDYHEGLANSGRIMRIDDRNDPSKSQTYAYDGLHRLISAETDGSHWGLQWSYDRYGNRLSQSAAKGSPPTHSASVDAYTNRVTSWSYDEAGNVLNDGRHIYAYDANNMVVDMDSGAAAYAYDGQGGRVMKTVNGVTTYYFWGHEYKTGWSKLFVYAAGEKLAEYSGGTTRFFHANHLGTPVARTDLSGSQNASWTHYPFGERWESTGFGGDQHKYTGHLQDGESGNAYAGARYYESGSGRWSSVDPVEGDLLNPQSLNRHSYVLNDPVNLVDSTGGFFEFVNCRLADSVLPGENNPLEICQVIFRPGPVPARLERLSFGGLPFLNEVRGYVARITELLSTPIATEEISDECKSQFGEFIDAVRQDPSMIVDVPTPRIGGVGTANLRTLEIAYSLIDTIRVNRGFVATVVTGIGGADGVTFFNIIFLRPTAATDDLNGVGLLFHEFYHVGQFFTSPLAFIRLVGEQIFSGSRGPLEREAYAAEEAFKKWVTDTGRKPCSPLVN